MYELCQKEPPFNARTHIQLIQKIRDGRFAPLPDVYSAELKSVISSCLRVNPNNRPDTAALLKMPVIRLMRKEKEVTHLANSLRTREETAVKKMKEVEHGYARLEKEKGAMRVEIESTVRREWEVKARLEIDRQVQLELERLRRRFEVEVQERVATELQKLAKPTTPPKNNTDLLIDVDARSSIDTTGEDDFPSSTDLSELSMESPTADKDLPAKKGTRTPFTRSKTTFESPRDIQMAESSPMSLVSLSLSPRRTAERDPARNIFAEGSQKNPKWEPTTSFSDDEDDIPDLPSPTRPRAKADPSRAPSRPLVRQNTTALMQKLSSQPPLFPASKSGNTTQSVDSRPAPSEPKPKSPSRRLSKIPSSSNLSGDGGSPVRKAAAKQQPQSKANGGGEEMLKAVMQRNMGGRTLVELAQARAGGRPVEELKRNPVESKIPTAATQVSVPTKGVERDAPAVWNPEVDEMPSPFLARGAKVIRNLR